MTVLQTTRLTLAPCHPRDEADFISLERDPAVMRFLNGGHAVDRTHADPNATFLMPTGTEPHVRTARYRRDDAFIGWFCLWPESESRAELGYRLRRTAWGQGLASEGASALVGWGFANRDYEKIIASTMAVNHGSRRVMEKIGMRHTRTVPLDPSDAFAGSEHGEVWYEVSRGRWSDG